MRRALISIGTNSTRLLILDGPSVVAARSVGTRLGRGLDVNGSIDPAAASATLRAVGDYMAEVRRGNATIDAIATSALRRAHDAAPFVERVTALTGIAPAILSGDLEARYSFLGATFDAPPGRRVSVLDVGGGSTELAVGTPERIDRTISLELGAVRLAERIPALLGAAALDGVAAEDTIARARAEAERVLEPLSAFTDVGELIGVGGTLFTAAGMLSGDPARDGVAVSAGDRRRLIADLVARDLMARRAMAFIRPQRADILPAGLIVVDVACERLRVDTLRVSHADLLAGYLRSPAYRAAAVG